MPPAFHAPSQVIVLDIRVPTVPVALLSAHDASINSIAWAPHSECHICSAADDSMALIWDLMALPKSIDEPILVYNAPAPVNQLQWSKAHTDWVAIAYGDSMQLLRV
jgi:WD repeat-containing protein 68